MSYEIEYIRECIAYDKDTGDLTWKKKVSTKVKVGSKVGCVHKDGYLRVKLNGKYYLGHRLIWALVYGKLPEKFIDHINGIKNDNRLCNLRELSHSENMQNRFKASSHSASGFIGSSKNGRRYQAQIVIDKKKHYIGCFDTAEEAHAAYMEAKRKLHAAANFDRVTEAA